MQSGVAGRDAQETVAINNGNFVYLRSDAGGADAVTLKILGVKGVADGSNLLSGGHFRISADSHSQIKIHVIFKYTSIYIDRITKKSIEDAVDIRGDIFSLRPKSRPAGANIIDAEGKCFSNSDRGVVLVG